MNALQLNADIYNSLSVISLDEGLLKRAATYLKKIAQKKKDETLMTKEEYFAKIDRAMQQAERGEGREFSSKEEMNAWLNSL
ncbi:MAG: prevent-host-death protein [Bacteroidales bacterium]|nr:prevent-host-death protein [Bacteroidales bacterium]